MNSAKVILGYIVSNALHYSALYTCPNVSLLLERCAEFEDILPQWDVYCLVALTAYHSGFMGVCSR